MVKAGELGGVLELVLGRLAEFQEKAQKVKNKVKSAMIYPVIVLSLAMIIMAFLMVFIVPKFKSIFHDMLGDKPLRLRIPATTQNGQVFRLRGHGMPVVGKAQDRGDLYATAAVQLPTTLSPEQRVTANVRQCPPRRGRPCNVTSTPPSG